MANVYNNIGTLYKDMERYREAEQSYKEAIKIYNEIREGNYYIHIINDMAKIYKNLSELYCIMNNNDKAKGIDRISQNLLHEFKYLSSRDTKYVKKFNGSNIWYY